MAAVFVVSLLMSLLCCSVQAGITYQVAHSPARNMQAGAHHPDKAAISVASAGNNYAFSVLNSGPNTKVVQQQTAVSHGATAAAGPAVVHSTQHVAHAPTHTFVGAYGVPVVHQPLLAQPVAIVHQSPTLVHQVVDGTRHVFHAVPVAHPAHQVLVEPIVRQVPVPIPYASAAHHQPQLVHAGHVVPPGHVVNAPGHVVVPHSGHTVLLAHHKK